MQTETSQQKSIFPFLQGGGEMGERIRNFDWSKSPLGEPEQWPQGLRTTVSLLLHSQFPMFVWWGKELTTIYNDSYCAIAGEKHPALLGRSGREAWGEAWSALGPLVEKVFNGTSTWSEDLLLNIKRHDFIEETYFTFSYSPVLDETGAVVALFCACIETTEKVVARKKLQISESRFRRMIEHATIAIALTSGREMIIESINGLMLQIIDRSENVIGKRLIDVVPELEGQAVLEILHQVHDNQEIFRASEIVINLVINGKLQNRYYNLAYIPLVQPGAETDILHIAIDVTEQVEALKKIEESETNLRNTILQAPVAMCILRGPAFTVEIANERMFSLWGKEASDLLHKPLFDGLPEAKDQGFEALLESVYNKGEAVKAYGVPVALPRSGKVENVYIDFVYEAYREKDGSVTGIIAVATDVTQQLLSRQKIEQSEKRFQNLIRGASVGVVVLMGENLIVSVVNAAYGHLFNCTEEDLLNKPLFEVIPEAKDLFGDLLNQVRLTGEAVYLYDEPYSVYVKGREMQGYLNVVYQPYREADGHITGVTALLQDVTEQVEARQRLVEANEQAKLAIEAGGLGTVEVNLKTDEVIVSRRMEEIFEIKSGTDRGAFISKMHPEDLPLRKKAYDKALQDGFLEYEARVIKKDGSFRWIRAKGRVYFDEAKKPLRLVSVVHDITEQKLFAEELRKLVHERTAELESLNKELQRSNAYLEEFAHAASHDLKEPIRKIHVFTDRLRTQLSSKLTPEDARMFDRVEHATVRMNSLIDDLLLYSHVSQKPHEKEIIDLNAKVKRVLEDLELEIQEKNAIIEIGNLPTVLGYRRQLQQLFQNLLSNALKYSRPGVTPKIEMSAAVVTGSDAGLLTETSYHRITVADNGIGFQQDYAEKIFQMFQRLHGKNEYGGTGVGLSIARKVVENHNGKIVAQSEQGKGSQFHVYLPVE